jgi:hypothetical protein
MASRLRCVVRLELGGEVGPLISGAALAWWDGMEPRWMVRGEDRSWWCHDCSARSFVAATLCCCAVP